MNLEERMCALERQGRRWRSVCALQVLLMLSLLSLVFEKPRMTALADDGVLRAKGLIISDDNGKARVLLGAPFPQTRDRVRQDDRTAAMIFLDESGHDRLTLGEATKAQVDGTVPKNKHRLGTGYGVTIHDLQGDERGGFGFSTIGRATIALDRVKGDAWAAIVDDKTDFAGTVSLYSPNIGENITGVLSGTQGRRAFVHLKDTHDTPREQFEVGPDGTATIDVLNEHGEVEKDLLKGSTQ